MTLFLSSAGPQTRSQRPNSHQSKPALSAWSSCSDRILAVRGANRASRPTIGNAMKICVVQARSERGDIEGNVVRHQELIDLAVSTGANTIIFPELSLTGYEPTLAKALATTPGDTRLDGFQKVTDAKQVTIGVGLPIKHDAGICIGMVLFRPQCPRASYLKQYIHHDEEPFFVAGTSSDGLLGNGIALAICYELSVSEHAEAAFQNGATIYVASAVKSVNGIDKATKRLSEIASRYSMTVLLANAVGQADGEQCGGKTAILDRHGRLAAQLDDSHEGILIFDTDTQAISLKHLDR